MYTLRRIPIASGPRSKSTFKIEGNSTDMLVVNLI